MSKKNVSALVGGMGVAMTIITNLVQKAREKNFTDEDLHRLATPEGDLMLDCFIELMVVDRELGNDFKLSKQEFTGETDGPISLSRLYQVTVLMGKHYREVRLQGYREALAAHGVTDCSTLLEKGDKWFQKTAFPPYGRGPVFASLILNMPKGHLAWQYLLRIAGSLGWPSPSSSPQGNRGYPPV